MAFFIATHQSFIGCPGSDLHESCNHAYRKGRGDEPVKLEVNGHEIGGITALTIHNSGPRDSWLHCWFKIGIPEDDAELEDLGCSVNRMRQEFGLEYTFIPANYIRELVNRLKSVTAHEISHGTVECSGNRTDWSAACKSEKYSYQREYRFLVGGCEHTCVEPLILRYENGFEDLITKSPKLRIENKEQGRVWFHLDADNCVFGQSS